MKVAGLKSERTYLVWRFLPSRCPNCFHRFRRQGKDFVEWWGRGKSRYEAMRSLGKDFPEMYEVKTNQKRYSITNRFETDFIQCNHCKNTTLRIMYASGNVRTKAEADHLMSEAVWTCYQPASSTGHMAKPWITLAFLGAADLDKLEEYKKSRGRGAGSMLG